MTTEKIRRKWKRHEVLLNAEEDRKVMKLLKSKDLDFSGFVRFFLLELCKIEGIE